MSGFFSGFFGWLMAAAWSCGMAGPATLRFLIHRGGRLSYHKACLWNTASTASSTKQLFNNKNIRALFRGVLFGLLLLVTAAVPVCGCLARVNNTGKLPDHRALPVSGLGTNIGLWPVDALTVSFHHNLLGYFAIHSSVLRHRRAQVQERLTGPTDRSSITPCRRITDLVFLLLMLSGDIQLNPGPVSSGTPQNFGADPTLRPSVSGSPPVPMVVSEHELSERGFSLNGLNFIKTRCWTAENLTGLLWPSIHLSQAPLCVETQPWGCRAYSKLFKLSIKQKCYGTRSWNRGGYLVDISTSEALIQRAFS